MKVIAAVDTDVVLCTEHGQGTAFGYGDSCKWLTEGKYGPETEIVS